MERKVRKGHWIKKGKRYLALFLSLCLIGTMLPVSAKEETLKKENVLQIQEDEKNTVVADGAAEEEVQAAGTAEKEVQAAGAAEKEVRAADTAEKVQAAGTPDGASQSGNTPAPKEDKTTCTCSKLCKEEHLNPDCPVCGNEGADLSQCTGKEQTKSDEEQKEQKAECSCSERCTTDNIHTDCPVCGAEDADLNDCKGKSEEKDEKKGETARIITAWKWIDEEEYIDEETGRMSLPGASREMPAYFDDVTALLPTQIQATVENAEDSEAESAEEPITLGDWSCEDYPKSGAYSGSYTFTATLPEGYTLSEEAKALSITVELGGVQVQMYRSVESKAVGNFTVIGGTLDTDYTYADGVLTIKTATPITIANTDPGKATTDRIEVADGVSANITLAGVNIDVSGSDNTAAFKIADNSRGNVTITLADGSENTLISDYNRAGLQKNGSGGGIGKLTIQGGTGKLTASSNGNGAGIGGGYKGSGSNITISGGTVTATGGQGGAGIGGGYGGSGSNITISGGTVTATGGGGGAGIGGGYAYVTPSGLNGSPGSNIIISGGTVTATGGMDGAGIGGGYRGSGSNIIISGGTVTVTGGELGAGIGGGNRGSGSNIKIRGGSVKAVAGENANAIGGGFGKEAFTPTNDKDPVYLLTIANPDSAEVYIDGAAYSPVNHKAAGSKDGNLYTYLTGEEHRVQVGNKIIFYKFDSESKTFAVAPLTISGTLTYGADYTYENNVLTIKTTTPVTIANIDPEKATTDRIEVAKDVSADITLAGVNIDVSSSYDAAFKIANNSTGDVTITLADGSKNTLISGIGCAGLQKIGSGNTIGKLTIQGSASGTATVTGGAGGAGIGGGHQGSGTNITISGGTITATGGTDTVTDGLGGAGIGGGAKSFGSAITISGGTVTASSDNGAGIGGGKGGSGTNITISGGIVIARGNSGAGIGGGFKGSGSDITISGGIVTAGSDEGAGIGGGNDGSGSDITISGGSVKAEAGEKANAIGGGFGREAFTPTNDKDPVYLLTIANPDSAEVYIDGVLYSPVNHKAAGSNDGNLYAYLTGETHEIKVGEKTYIYVFDSGSSTFTVAPLTAYATNGGTLTYGVDYTYENNVLTIKSDTAVTIANTDPDKATTDRIEVADGVSADITLAGVNIDVSSSSNTAAFQIADNSTGNVTITLADGSENTLKSGKNCAGLQKNGEGDTIGKLTIQSGASGTGKLNATGVNGAGIGGGYKGSGTNITISGGTVTATSSYSGAGVGGGINGDGLGIIISGGSVKAEAGENANAIGGGSGKDAATPTLADGTTPVYLLEIANDSGTDITINGTVYPTNNNGEKKIYVYLPGQEVTVTAASPTGYKLTGWTVVRGNVTLNINTDKKTATFTMPQEAVSLKTEWQKEENSSSGGSGNAGGSGNTGGSDNTGGSGNTGGSTNTGRGNTNPGTENATVIPGTLTTRTTPVPGIANNLNTESSPGIQPGNTGTGVNRPDTGRPYIKGDTDKEGWEAIRDEVRRVQEGGTITVDMNGSSVVPGDVLDEIKGKEVTIVFAMNNGITWSVNGQSITGDKTGDIDFSVKAGTDTIPLDVINKVTGERYSRQISLAYDGEFGFTAVLSINMEANNAGLYANLFYYNEKTKALEFICADEIAEDGTAELTFTHASDYAIVIDQEPMDRSVQVTSPESESPGTEVDTTQTGADYQDAGNSWWMIMTGGLVIIIGLSVFFVVKKKKPEAE